jgi:uncharacterized protein YndB with AHSA1/START domain
MSLTNVTHSTFTIERSYPHAPERVFSAFATPEKRRRWFAEAENRKPEEFQMDFRVGGRDLMSFRMGPDSPFPGAMVINHTTYLDIVPDRRIVYAYSMTLGEHRFSASLATFEFRASATGTDLIFTEQGAFFEGADGPKMRQEGWSHLIDSLTAELGG